MSDSKVFMFPDGNTGNSNGLDPNLLLALNNGGFGGNGNWMWIIFLFFLYPLMRNGGWFGNNNDGCNGHGGFGPLANMINNNDGRQLLNDAINRNGCAIDKLASMFGCGKDVIVSAINGVQQSICSVGNQTNMSIADVKYALSLGNQSIGQQLASCCCDIKEAITAGSYQNQLQTVNQTNTLQQAINGVATGQERGFSAVAYESAKQTCELKGEIKDLGTQVAKHFADLETRALQDKIATLQETKSTLLGQLSNNAQTAQFAAMLAPLQKEVSDIKCKLPETVTTPYQPFVAVPNCVAYNTFGLGAGLYNGGSIWS